jgi:GT2 family glycosyltransferase
MVDLSIIILTWNSRDLLKACLDSVYGTIKATSFEVIVIDNASGDDTVEMVQQKYPDVILVRNRKNRGMPARNQGLVIGRGNFLFLLDVDTVVHEHAIDRMVDYHRQHSEIGLLAAKIFYGDGSLDYSCRKFPTVLTKIARRSSSEWARRIRTNEELLDWDHNTVREVDYVTGACQMIRRDAYKKVGPIDENIFYGPEDCDYCLRVWQAGYKVVYYPNATITHFAQRVTKKQPFSKLSWIQLKALCYYFLKHKYFFSRDNLYKKPAKNT